MPGRTANRRIVSSSIAATSTGSEGRGPTSDISPRSTLRSCGSSSIDERRSRAPNRVTRGSCLILKSTPSYSLAASRPALRSSAPQTIVRSLRTSKSLAVLAHPHLPEEGRAGRVQPDGDHEHQQERAQKTSRIAARTTSSVALTALLARLARGATVVDSKISGAATTPGHYVGPCQVRRTESACANSTIKRPPSHAETFPRGLGSPTQTGGGSLIWSRPVRPSIPSAEPTHDRSVRIQTEGWTACDIEIRRSDHLCRRN